MPKNLLQRFKLSKSKPKQEAESPPTPTNTTEPKQESQSTATPTTQEPTQSTATPVTTTEAMANNVFYRQVGKSGLKVSVPVLGAMAFGSQKWAPWVLDEEKGMEILKAAWDHGINTIDTANLYSNGESERIIGDFIVKYNIPRENLVIMTKAFLPIDASDPGSRAAFNPATHNTRAFVNQGGLSRAALHYQIDQSLKRLRTSYIDLFQIHAFDPVTPMEETMRTLHELIIAGKLRYIGASNLRTWQLAEMNHVAEKNGWTPFISIQLEHSLLQRPEEREMFEYCKHKGIGILAYSPMCDGRLARPVGVETTRSQFNKGRPTEKKLKESDHEIIKRVQELAEKKSMKMSQIALSWSAAKVSSPIVGANSTERVAEAVIPDKVLTEEDQKYLEELYEYHPFRM